MFLQKKQIALKSLKKAKEDKLVDEEIMPLVDLINKYDSFYTTSSCLGRIVVSESQEDDNKKEYVWLGKWHRKVKLEEVKKALEKNQKGIIWFKMESAILHICCRRIEDADKLLKCAKKAGLKRTGIVQISPRIMVEIIGGDYLSTPILTEINEKMLQNITNIANSRFEKNLKKLDNFKTAFIENI